MSPTVELPFTPPLDDAALLEHFGARAVAGVEELGAKGYRRSLRLAHGGATVSLGLGVDRVHAGLELDDDRDRGEAQRTCRRILGLDGDPGAIAAALGGDPLIGPAVRASPGRRLPGAADGAELAVRAVLGQQISLAGAAAAAARLVADHGEPLARPRGGVTHLFPTAAALAGADPGTLRMPRARGRTLIALSTALAAGEIVLAPDADLQRARQRLLALPGIGPWTVDYVAMRVFGDHDVFLATDLGVRRALERNGLPGDPRSAAALAQRWRPYRSYAMQYLWTL